MRQQYGLGETIRNFQSLIYTKLFFSRARLIRLPFYLRGKHFLRYGAGLTVGYGCRFEMYRISPDDTEDKLVIGEKCFFGDYVHISACQHVKVGNNCLFASHILVTDNSHGNYVGENSDSPDIPPNERSIVINSVKIGNNVWVGDQVCILPGSEIGDGCIVGAGSVVKNSFPSNCMIAGVPAKIIKVYDEIERTWKKYNPQDV